MRGRDITAYKRTLSHAGYIKWDADKFTPYFGKYFETTIKNFQRDRKLRVDGIIGRATHEALEDAKNPNTGKTAWDAFSIDMYKDYCAGTYKRDSIIDAWHYWYTIRDKISYAQIRPIVLLKPPAYSPRMDCSWYVTVGYYAGGAPDPNGRGYDGQGYTGTLLGHGTRISLSNIKPADLVFYGFTRNPSPAFPYGSPTHVAGYAGDGMVYSMGSSVGPSFYDMNYRSDINSYATYDLGG